MLFRVASVARDNAGGLIRCYRVQGEFASVNVYLIFQSSSGFTHIIQLWHDGAAAPHFEFEEVEYLLRVAQRLQDVHVASGV